MSKVLRCSGYDLIKADMVRARGCCLYDRADKRYVDFEAGVWCAGLGHNHERVNRTIRDQIEKVSHIGYRYTNEVVEEAAAEALGAVSLSEGKCVFLSSGSEAVEFGVQSARRITGRPLLLTLSDSYLAAYGSAGNKSSAEWLAFDWGVCVGCSRAERCDPRCEHLGEIPFEKMGGLVFEPGNSGGSVRLPPPGLVRILESEIKKQQGLIVVDEVTTGLGRTGTWCGYHHYRMRPDVVALGKGLGNGYPVSAVVMTEEAAGQLENRGFHYAQSHQNDPLGCAVAREVIRILREERLVERSRRVGADFLANLKELAKRHDSLREARGRGLMIVLEFEKAGGTSRLLEVYRALLERGHLAGCKPAAELLRFYPPLTIAEDDIDRLLGDLDRILRSLT